MKRQGFLRLLLACIAVTAAQAQVPVNASKPSAASEVDLRPGFEQWKLPPKKQGARNTCSVMTTVGAMEYALAKKLNRGIPLSAEYLNWACNKIINNSTEDRGQFFHDLVKGYELYGVCTEAEMPYATNFMPGYQPSARATNDAGVIHSYGLRPHWLKPYDGKTGVSDDHLEQIRATLRKGWPVCAGSFHSVLFVGYKDAASLEGGGGFYVRDSGEGKQGIMSYKEARERLCDLLWFDTEEPKTNRSPDIRGGLRAITKGTE